MKLTVKNKLVLFFASGTLILIAGGYLGWFGFPNVINGQILMFKRLDKNETFDAWIELPVPLDFKVYFFNVTNPNDVLNKKLPEFTEVGPYVYELYISRDLLNTSNPKIFRYMNRAKYIFNEAKSNGLKESDVMTIINVPFMAVALYLERYMPIGLDLLEETLPYLFKNENPLFLTDSVGNFLFNGVPLSCTEESESFCLALKSKPLKSLKYNEATGDFSFAFFRDKNGTSGPYEIDKGLDDAHKVGQILSYKDDTVLNTWVPNSTCDTLKGTDSTIFGPFISTEPLEVFEPDICFSGTAEYLGEEEYMGIPVSKFLGSRNNFEDGVSNCRCSREDYTDSTSQLDCLSPGLIDLTPCQGAPVIASQPHFYQGSDSLQFSSKLRPEAEKHQTYSLIERVTGVPLKGKKRIQLNVQLKPIEDITILTNVTNIIFPILWAEEGVELEGEILEPIIKLYSVLAFLKIAKWVLLAIGLGLIFLGIVYYAYHRNNLNDNKAGKSESGSDPQRVLFNKVTRGNDFNSHSSNLTNATQISPTSFIRERLNNNLNSDGSYVMTLESSLYPSTLDARNLQNKM